MRAGRGAEPMNPAPAPLLYCYAMLCCAMLCYAIPCRRWASSTSCWTSWRRWATSDKRWRCCARSCSAPRPGRWPSSCRSCSRTLRCVRAWAGGQAAGSERPPWQAGKLGCGLDGARAHRRCADPPARRRPTHRPPPPQINVGEGSVFPAWHEDAPKYFNEGGMVRGGGACSLGARCRVVLCAARQAWCGADGRVLARSWLGKRPIRPHPLPPTRWLAGHAVHLQRND